jgi:outer membrane murein-binding lipoprotein Lpp
MDPAAYQAKLQQLTSQISEQNAQVTQLRQILQQSGNLVPSANP